MGEVRLLQHSKDYLDQLARGVDPISGRAVPEDSVLNQEKLSKCFQYVSQVLQREIDRLNPPEPAAVKETIESICVSLGYTGYRMFLSRGVYGWLEQEGYITNQPREGSTLKDRIPTPEGERLGFSVKKLLDKEGSAYLRLCCSGAGQQFLRDSVGQIMEFERKQWDPLLACLTPEWHRQAAVSAEPVHMMELVNAVNRQLPQDLPRRLHRDGLNAWMLKNGLLEEVIANGRRSKLPTPAGEQVGIVKKSYRSDWTSDAQRFVMDNLDGIIRDMASGEIYKVGTRKLVLTDAVRSQILANPKNIGPRLLEDKINQALEAAGSGPKVLPRNLILDWLRREEYVQWEEMEDGSKFRRPTGKGNAVGIIVDDSTGYTLFTEGGQRFVLDHLEEMVEFYRSK